MCVGSIALGGQWEGVGQEEMPAFSPEPFPPQPTRCCKHKFVNKKSHKVFLGPLLMDITVQMCSGLSRRDGQRADKTSL